MGNQKHNYIVYTLEEYFNEIETAKQKNSSNLIAKSLVKYLKNKQSAQIA